MVRIRDAVDEWSLKATNDILTALADNIEDGEYDADGNPVSLGGTSKPTSSSTTSIATDTAARTLSRNRQQATGSALDDDDATTVASSVSTLQNASRPPTGLSDLIEQ